MGAEHHHAYADSDEGISVLLVSLLSKPDFGGTRLRWSEIGHSL